MEIIESHRDVCFSIYNTYSGCGATATAGVHQHKLRQTEGVGIHPVCIYMQEEVNWTEIVFINCPLTVSMSNCVPTFRTL